jgi:hypothetical protein
LSHPDMLWTQIRKRHVRTSLWLMSPKPASNVNSARLTSPSLSSSASKFKLIKILPANKSVLIQKQKVLMLDTTLNIMRTLADASCPIRLLRIMPSGQETWDLVWRMARPRVITCWQLQPSRVM